MSAPQTNLERQKRRHRGPLIGMIAVVAFALLLFFAFNVYTAEQGQTPEATAPQIDGRTGESVPAD